jgi:hypothetical protein
MVNVECGDNREVIFKLNKSTKQIKSNQINKNILIFKLMVLLRSGSIEPISINLIDKCNPLNCGWLNISMPFNLTPCDR